ncbi:MAG: LytR C-terminal domain-containing protein [Treponema sp.]|nr:LytR C-terminal domain-containing protein [Treponema sp.]
MRKVRFDASPLLLSLIALILIGGVIFVVIFLRSDPFRESLSGNRVINILFVIENSPSPAGDPEPLKPLSTYVLMYHPVTRRAALVDIPGSVGLIIQRINRVDRIDTVYDPRRIGPYVSEIETLLGLEIPFSIVISLENLGRITDLIQGVEVFIPSPVQEYQNGHILFPSGVSVLDGDKAVVFASYELPEENTELVSFRRQRFFIGFIKRLGEQNRYLRNPQVGQLFHSMLRTGMNRRTQERLFDELVNIDMDRISLQTVGGSIREVSGQPLLFPHWDGSLIKEIVRDTTESLMQSLESSRVDRVFTVEVLNGTNVTGLAGRTAELFRGFGYDIMSIGNADRNDYERTLIIDRSGYQDMARIFGDIIHCVNIRFETPGFVQDEIEEAFGGFESRSDFTLIIGRDFNGRFVAQ